MKGIDRTARSYYKAMAILSRTDPSSATGPVIEDFPVPPPRKRARKQLLAHEDSADQYAGSPCLSAESSFLTWLQFYSRRTRN